MKTSIVMATYNGEKYLIEQLDSLRMQTLPADEVIFCDDVSKDGTASIIQEYILRFQLEDKWFFIQNDTNLGYAGNFFKALQMAKGDIIFFCDQDDIWHNDKLQETVAVMETRKDIHLLCSDYSPFSCSASAPKVPDIFMKRMKYDGSIEHVELNNKNIFISSIGCVMCIRKEFRDQISDFWVQGWAHDDFVWKTSLCVDGCFFYHKSMIERRLHDNNVSMRKKHSKDIRIKFLKELEEANTGMYKFAKSVNLDVDKLKLILRTIKAAELRRELIEKCRLINVFRLLLYFDCYQNKKAFFMEPIIALRNK